jgi:hypothetical protein
MYVCVAVCLYVHVYVSRGAPDRGAKELRRLPLVQASAVRLECSKRPMVVLCIVCADGRLVVHAAIPPWAR